MCKHSGVFRVLLRCSSSDVSAFNVCVCVGERLATCAPLLPSYLGLLLQSSTASTEETKNKLLCYKNYSRQYTSPRLMLSLEMGVQGAGSEKSSCGHFFCPLTLMFVCSLFMFTNSSIDNHYKRLFFGSRGRSDLIAYSGLKTNSMWTQVKQQFLMKIYTGLGLIYTYVLLYVLLYVSCYYAHSVYIMQVHILCYFVVFLSLRFLRYYVYLGCNKRLFCCLLICLVSYVSSHPINCPLFKMM